MAASDQRGSVTVFDVIALGLLLAARLTAVFLLRPASMLTTALAFAGGAGVLAAAYLVVYNRMLK